MAESTKILQNVKIKPSWTGTYTLTNTDADYLVSGQNLVVGFQKLNAWIAKFDTDVEGVRTVAKGGTGKGTLTTNAVLLGNGTTAIKEVASASGAFYATAANAEPQFGTLPVAQGGTGATSPADARTSLDVYSKSETDAKIDDRLQELSVMNIKGTVAKFEELPSTNVHTGDLYLVGTADATDDSFEEYVYTSQGWEYLGKHQVASNEATNSVEGIVYLSDATNGTETAASGHTAATPKAVSDAKDEAIIAAKDARSKTSASATATNTGSYAYEIGSVTVTDSTDGVDGTPATTTFYGHDTTYTAEKGVTLDTTTNKFKASLANETADTAAAGTGQLYAVKLDANSKLAVNVPWTDQNVTQTATTTAGYYPLLFANSSITPTNDPPTSTTDITNATIKTETAGVNKNKHIFVNIDGTTGNATLYSDVFVGLTTTPAANTNDGQLASTAFVQSAIAAALSTNITNFFTGEKGVSVAYDATSGKVKVGHTQTYTAQATAGIYKTTVDTYGHVSSATAAGVDDLANLTATTTNKGKMVATDATSGQIVFEDWSVLELNCVAD